MELTGRVNDGTQVTEFSVLTLRSLRDPPTRVIVGRSDSMVKGVALEPHDLKKALWVSHECAPDGSPVIPSRPRPVETSHLHDDQNGGLVYREVDCSSQTR